MTTLVRFFDIDWETDGEDVDLPDELIIPMEIEARDLADRSELKRHIDTYGAGYLSDKTGWLVNSFDWALCSPA